MPKETVLEARNLKKYFPMKGNIGKAANRVKAVDDVSLKLYRGETYGLVGETGCGKSTLGRTLMKLVEPTAGTIYMQDKDITHYSEKEMRPVRSYIQMVFQDPYSSLNPRKKVGQILEEVLTIQKIKCDKQKTVLNILEKVGLRKEHYYRFPHEFSGGQRQRIGLARALILDPRIVVCDEPVSALDVSIQSQIINLLLDLKEERDLSYIFIAHDISVVKFISDRIGVMYLGHLVEEAKTDELFSNPLHPYTKALLSAVPEANPHIQKKRIVLQGDLPSPLNPPEGCVFHERCPYAIDICSQDKPVEKEPAREHKVCCHRFE